MSDSERYKDDPEAFISEVFLHSRPPAPDWWQNACEDYIKRVSIAGLPTLLRGRYYWPEIGPCLGCARHFPYERIQAGTVHVFGASNGYVMCSTCVVKFGPKQPQGAIDPLAEVRAWNLLFRDKPGGQDGPRTMDWVHIEEVGPVFRIRKGNTTLYCSDEIAEMVLDGSIAEKLG